MWVSPGMKAWFNTRICIIVTLSLWQMNGDNYIIIPKDAVKYKVLN